MLSRAVGEPYNGVLVGLGRTRGCFGPRVSGRASPPSCQRVQRVTGDCGGSSVLTRAGMLWGTPYSPYPPAGRKRNPGSVTLRPTRVSPSLQRDHMRFLFHKTEDGISIVLAGDVLQRGSRFHPLSSSPQRRSLSLCQGDPSHPAAPPHSHQIWLHWPRQPSSAGPSAGIAPPPALWGSEGPSSQLGALGRGPHQVRDAPGR